MTTKTVTIVEAEAEAKPDVVVMTETEVKSESKPEERTDKSDTDAHSTGIPTVLENYYVENNAEQIQPRLRLNGDSMPPDYARAMELGVMSPVSSTSDNSDNESLPAYDTSVGDATAASSSTTSVTVSTAPGFQPIRQFQIENRGHPLIALPISPKPDPIPVLSIEADGTTGAPAYTSLRQPGTSSNSCVLVRANDDVPVSVTHYRFGPNRPPKLHLTLGSTEKVTSPEQVGQILEAGVFEGVEPIELHGDGVTTRAHSIRTALGTFRWRYGNKTERKEAQASSLLLFERITSVVNEKGKIEERRRRVAQLVRNDEFRTEGSSKRTAGNGGRLMIDMREWLDKKGEADEVEVLAVATCLVMLKKEIDRRRLHQTVVIVAGVGGAV